MRSIKLAALALAFATGAALAHDYQAGDVFIDHPFTRATPPAANVAGGYMTLRNEGDEADRLLGGETSAAGTVEIHSMEIVDDVARMRPLPEGLEVPPGTQVELR